jgi:hypothetical protein
VILAKDLERLVNRWAPLVKEIVNALLPGYQFFPLLPRLGQRLRCSGRLAMLAAISAASGKASPFDPVLAETLRQDRLLIGACIAAAITMVGAARQAPGVGRRFSGGPTKACVD